MTIYKIQKRELEKEGMPENEWVDVLTSTNQSEIISTYHEIIKCFAETNEFQVVEVTEKVVE